VASTLANPVTAARRARSDGRALAAWIVLVVAGVVLGGRLTAADEGLHTNASPFHGYWEVALGRGIAFAAVVAVVVVALGPVAAARLPWRSFVAAASVAAFVWAVALAVSVGGHGLVTPLTTPYEYLAGVGHVAGPGHFLRHFTSSLPGLPTHVEAHPPGLVLVLWGLHRIGLGAPVWAALFVVGASAVAAVLLTVRHLAGEATARAAAPFLVLAPAAVWMATSGDAFFTGIGAWAIAATVVATSRHRRRWSVVAGVAWAAALLSSYGLVLLSPVAIAVAVSRRRFDVLLATGATSVLVLAAFGLATGFWWPAGLSATHRAYEVGYAATRSPSVFVWLNVAAVAVAAGPALLPALRRARGPVALLAFGAVAGLALADISLLSKGEVERIWLPWLPWMLVATAALPIARRRHWLSFQAATAVVLQVALRSPW
jgi:hypothetical protein